jgi:hypothetical protein
MRTMPKAVTPKPTKAKKPTQKKPTQTRTKKATPPTFSKEERTKMIETAAYHIAEKDGFRPGREQEYWFQAERQIKELFPESSKANQPEVH